MNDNGFQKMFLLSKSELFKAMDKCKGSGHTITPESEKAHRVFVKLKTIIGNTTFYLEEWSVWCHQDIHRMDSKKNPLPSDFDGVSAELEAFKNECVVSFSPKAQQLLVLD